MRSFQKPFQRAGTLALLLSAALLACLETLGVGLSAARHATQTDRNRMTRDDLIRKHHCTSQRTLFGGNVAEDLFNFLTSNDLEETGFSESMS